MSAPGEEFDQSLSLRGRLIRVQYRPNSTANRIGVVARLVVEAETQIGRNIGFGTLGGSRHSVGACGNEFAGLVLDRAECQLVAKGVVHFDVTDSPLCAGNVTGNSLVLRFANGSRPPFHFLGAGTNFLFPWLANGCEIVGPNISRAAWFSAA